MRDVSKDFATYVLSLSSEYVFAFMVEFRDGAGNLPAWGGRLTSYEGGAVLFDGEKFISAQMKVQFPRTSLIGNAQGGYVKMQNVSRQIVGWLRGEDVVPKLILSGGLVMSSQNAVVYDEIGPLDYNLGEISQTANELTIPISVDPLFAKAVNRVQFSPAFTPALYA